MPISQHMQERSQKHQTNRLQTIINIGITPKTSTPLKVFSSNIKKLAITQTIVSRLPRRTILCINSATHNPCNPLPLTRIHTCTLSVVSRLIRRNIGTLIVTYGSTDTTILHSTHRHCSIPIVRIVRPTIHQTTQIANGGQITIVNARTAIASKTCRSTFTTTPKVRLFVRTYPHFIRFIRTNVANNPRLLHITRRCLLPLQRTNISALILKYARCPLLANIVR